MMEQSTNRDEYVYSNSSIGTVSFVYAFFFVLLHYQRTWSNRPYDKMIDTTENPIFRMIVNGDTHTHTPSCEGKKLEIYEAVKRLYERTEKKPVFSKQLKHMSDKRHSSGIVDNVRKTKVKMISTNVAMNLLHCLKLNFFLSSAIFFCYIKKFFYFLFVEQAIGLASIRESNIQKCPEIENYASMLCTYRYSAIANVGILEDERISRFFFCVVIWIDPFLSWCTLLTTIRDICAYID